MNISEVGREIVQYLNARELLASNDTLDLIEIQEQVEVVIRNYIKRNL